MKIVIASLMMVLSLSSFGNYKWELERNLKILSQQVSALTSQNADLLSVQELRDSIRKMKDLKITLLGLNRDYPTPVCSQETPELFKKAFKSIKYWARSVKGPELSETEATEYAVDWTNTYPCYYSDHFEKSFLTIKRYAGATNGGLGLPTSEAISYATEMTPRFCGDFEFKRTFWPIYKLAKYEMDLSEEESVAYAKRVVERDHFSCRWDDRLINNDVDMRNYSTSTREVCITPVPIIIPGVPNLPNMAPMSPMSPVAPR